MFFSHTVYDVLKKQYTFLTNTANIVEAYVEDENNNAKTATI